MKQSLALNNAFGPTSQHDDLTIDGKAEDGFTWEGDSTRGPFIVFNVTRQQNVSIPYRFKWQARLALVAIRSGRTLSG